MYKWIRTFFLNDFPEAKEYTCAIPCILNDIKRPSQNPYLMTKLSNVFGLVMTLKGQKIVILKSAETGLPHYRLYSKSPFLTVGIWLFLVKFANFHYKSVFWIVPEMSTVLALASVVPVDLASPGCLHPDLDCFWMGGEGSPPPSCLP